MSQALTHDLVNNLSGGASIKAGSTNLSGTTASTGTAVDCNNLSGPIHGMFTVGAAVNTPTSFQVTCTLTESDTEGGSYTAIANASTLVISTASSFGFVRALRTKRWVKCVATPAFVGGSSPEIPICANVVGQKQNY